MAQAGRQGETAWKITGTNSAKGCPSLAHILHQDGRPAVGTQPQKRVTEKKKRRLNLRLKRALSSRIIIKSTKAHFFVFCAFSNTVREESWQRKRHNTCNKQQLLLYDCCKLIPHVLLMLYLEQEQLVFTIDHDLTSINYLLRSGTSAKTFATTAKKWKILIARSNNEHTIC